MAFKPSMPITEVNGFDIKPGYYGQFRMATVEESRQALINAWTTPEQRERNAAHHTCGRCRGRGYTRRDQRVGCFKCGGTGSLPNGSTD